MGAELFYATEGTTDRQPRQRYSCCLQFLEGALKYYATFDR